MIIAGVAVWQSTKPIQTVGKPVDRVLAMPTGPSIAVLPFDNLSGDPEQEYFSDGLTEDLITELARFKDLRVLARNTTFQYKGKAIDITQLGRDLGVGYVVEGSVRRAGDRIRINIQLIDAQSGDHLWADKFDREFKDVFDLQDEITATVVGVIASGRGGVLQRAERAQARGKRTEDMRAYDYLLQARVNVVFSRDEHEQRKALLLKALDLDPDYARAREEYAWLLMMGWVFRFEDSPEPPAALKENAIRSVELDPSDAHAQRTAAYGYFFDKQLDRFKQHAELALELAPNNAEILVQMGMAYSFIGDSDRGLRLAEKAKHLNAVSVGGWYHTAWFYPLYLQGRYEEAIEKTRGRPIQKIAETQMKYVMAYGQLGDAEKAMEHWKNCLEMEPDWSAQRIINILELWNFPKNDIEKLMDGVYKAGIPRPGAEPVRPVIAVLPFDNMSGDPEQGYFSDGITEDIITGLSLFPDILVIARNSTFQYKGKAVDVRRVGKELGATYVVEGSVRRSGDRIRVTAQLLDATDGSHLWAETYDRDLSASDIFNLQDEIRGRVVATIADNYGILIQPRSEAATTKRTESLDAYECVLRAMKYLADVLPESHKESRACLERAVEIDPDYAEAWAWLSFVYMGEYQWGYNARPDPLDRALAAAKRAVELNPRSQTAHWGLATIHFLRHELDQFYVAAEKTVSLNPNNSGPLGAFGNWMAFAGNWERGFEWTDMAIALNPVHPSWYYFAHVYPHYLQGNYEAALEDAHKINMPGFYWYHIVLAASSAQMGQKDLAAQAVEDLLTAYPGFTLRTLRDELRIWNFRDEHIEPLVDGLRMAGLGASGEPTAGD